MILYVCSGYDAAREMQVAFDAQGLPFHAIAAGDRAGLRAVSGLTGAVVAPGADRLIPVERLAVYLEAYVKPLLPAGRYPLWL